VIQYFREVSFESIGRGVLDAPPSRGMTAFFAGKASHGHHGDIVTLIKDLKPKGSSTNPSSNRCYKRGMEQLAIKLLGFAAAACTTLAYAPQFVKVWKTRSTEDISLGMFLVMVLGLLLWLLYGLLSGDAPLIVANAITLVLAGGILWMKLKYG
jgi:MtN3 and saliva related transmembrane protein